MLISILGRTAVSIVAGVGYGQDLRPQIVADKPQKRDSTFIHYLG